LALAQGHSPRFANQRIHAIRLCGPQAMSKPTNGRRVEWLPGPDGNANFRDAN